MSRRVSPDYQTALTAAVRLPRYLLRIGFPSGTVLITTGDPNEITTRLGTPAHQVVDVDNLSRERVTLRFGLADTTYVADAFTVGLKGRTVQVWSYYEHGNTAQDGDLRVEFSGVINRIGGDMEVFELEAVQAEVLLPRRRINPTGGFSYVTPPGVVTIGGRRVLLRRNALR